MPILQDTHRSVCVNDECLCCRIRASLVVDSVIIPVVGVDAAIRGFHLVGTSDEIAIGSANDLRVHDELSPANLLLDRRQAR